MTAAAGTRRSWPPATLPDDPLAGLCAGATVAVAMSGGVDSSVAAALLVERGVRCQGITLAMWSRDAERDRGCCGVDAVEDARRICRQLGIPHLAWNLEEAFRTAVVDDFEAEYAAGRTPNPCVRCNERVKLGLLAERARAAGASHLATGHHARLGRRESRATLHHARDAAKDQAYALHRVGQRALAATVLPLAALPDKAAVRAEARRLGLATAAKPDSQELCFVEGTTREHLAGRLAGRYSPGEVVDAAGDVVGHHTGLPFVTVGQRRGLDLLPRGVAAVPLHVLRLEVATNRVVVGPRAALAVRSVVGEEPCWVDRPPWPGLAVDVRVRSGAAPVPGVVRATAPQLIVDLAEPACAVAPGQSMVLSVGDEVVGGAIVVSAA